MYNNMTGYNRIDEVYEREKQCTLPIGECFEIHNELGICLIDIVNYSTWCTRRKPEEIYFTMTMYNTMLTELLKRYQGVEKIEMVGDCVMIVSGISDAPGDCIDNLVMFCFELLERINEIKRIFDDDHISIRVGVHLGNICIGMTHSPRSYRIFGSDVNVASRLESTSLSGAVHVSERCVKRITQSTLLKHRIEIGKLTGTKLKGIGYLDTAFLFQKKTNEVLVCDDEPVTCKCIQRLIEKNTSYKTKWWTKLDSIVNDMYKSVYSLIILDRFYGEKDIVPIIREFRTWEKIHRNENQSILMISAYGSEPDDDLMVRQFIVKGAGFYNKLLKAIEMGVF